MNRRPVEDQSGSLSIARANRVTAKAKLTVYPRSSLLSHCSEGRTNVVHERLGRKTAMSIKIGPRARGCNWELGSALGDKMLYLTANDQAPRAAQEN
jgi:hypothetical protein